MDTNIKKYCKYPGCPNLIDSKYQYCFEHRNTPRKQYCKVHGWVINTGNGCPECYKMRRAVFRIHKKKIKGKNQYYYNRKLIDKDSYLYPYREILSNHNRTNAEQFVTKVTKGPGTYGIFIRNNRRINKLGDCLYIGQSINVQHRIGEHIENITNAEKYMKTGKNVGNIMQMYFGLGYVGLENLKLVKLLSVNKKYWNTLNREEKENLLTFFEQYNMDSFNPRFNVVQARPSEFNFLDKDGNERF